MPEKSPIRPTDDDARRLARSLMDGARHAALGVIDPVSQMPMVTRVAMATTPLGAPLSLISDLSNHTAALVADPRCSLLMGEPDKRGDPLTHPRLTLQCQAEFVRHGMADHGRLRAHYLSQQPKAKLYIDFADFSFTVFSVSAGHLNGGFGKAFILTPDDLAYPDLT